MGFVGTIFLFLYAVVGSALLSAVLAVILSVLCPHLPFPKQSPVWKFVAGAVYTYLLVFLLHFVWFSDYYACPSGKNVPVVVECSAWSVLSSAGSDALRASFYWVPYLALAYSVAFFVYHRIDVRNKYLRTLLSIWVFLLVVLVWLLVFPWTLEGYLSLFY